ncbi:class I SAM-dependent methyltransferase [Nonomuraea sp. NPDC050536]|uniref:class I SAM-dependent methyltransferase n=1 Tax=Nonomuraea sp. NPDC050536 TaxID=3364366 RepID=UPI0037CA54E6
MQDLSRFQHPRFARMYERMSAVAEQGAMSGYRDRLLAGLSGRVIEIGAGNGMNFAHYPREVTQVVAVEPEGLLRAAALKTAAGSAVPVEVVAGHADALPYEDGSFDAAVLSLVLCSVDDQAVTLAEARRVLRPGGELRFFEHVRSHHPVAALVQRVVTPVWSRAGGGCHLDRDTAAAIAASGLVVEGLDSFAFRPAKLAPNLLHILGTARNPS